MRKLLELLPLPGFGPSRAPHPVWSGSTSKPVEFTPLPLKAAFKLWRRAQEFDRQTKEKGRHGGAIGHTALKVLHALIFDFVNFRTGRLDPSHAAIARKTNLCPRAVAEALARLKDLRILAWVRRCWEGYEDRRYVRRQLTNAYAILPTGWRGFTPQDEPPPPHPDAWGKPPHMPSVHEAAVLAQRLDGDRREVIRILEMAPPNGIEAALARLGRTMQECEKSQISLGCTPHKET